MSMDVDVDGIFLENVTFDYDNYEYHDDFESRGPEAVIIPILYSLVIVIGLFGNGLLLAVLAQKRRSWSLSDTFILHLSIADVLLLVTLPLWAAEAAQPNGWCFGNFLCKLSGAVFHINFYCGILLLMCICLDRYLSIVHGTQLYSQKRSRFVLISCILVWLISLIITTPDWIFMVAQKGSTHQKTLCDQLAPRLLHHTIGFLLPTAILIICSSCILQRFLRSPKVLQSQRTFIMVILPLVGVFFLFWMPYNIVFIVNIIKGSSDEPGNEQSGNIKGSLQTAVMVTKALGCVHACLRPLLYLILRGNFRKRAVSMLRCATVEDDVSLWELGVGEEAPPDKSHGDEEEQRQMTSVDHQVQSTQC